MLLCFWFLILFGMHFHTLEARIAQECRNCTKAFYESVKLDNFIALQDFYDEAKTRLSLIPGAWEYLEGGSDIEFALWQSRKAFQKYIIKPRMLRDVSVRQLNTTILGKPTSFPVGIAPMAVQKLVHPEGECATARGAEAAGAIFVLSTMSTTSIEEIAECAPKVRKWFQLYYQKDMKVNQDLIRRAEMAEYEAIVLTVDNQLIGKRRAFLRIPFKLPDGARLANFPKDEDEVDATSSVNEMRDNDNPVREIALTWDAVKWIRSQTKLKVIIKGILTGEDARIAAELGDGVVDGIIVSNHGGRQLDSVSSTIEALEEVVKAVNNKFEVYLDGGVSLGTDVFKALALGAKMVFVGRGALCGLAVGGNHGVTKVLDILKSELDLTMGLSGVSKVCDVTPAYVRPYVPLP